MKKTCFGIIIVNYENAALAVQAARSALGAHAPSMRRKVVIVDNNSEDDSQDILQLLAQEGLWPTHENLSHLHNVSLAPWTTLSTALIKTEAGCKSSWQTLSGNPATADLVILQHHTNVGFAAGNNLGLEFLRSFNCTHYLLLNPDTVLEETALIAFETTLKDRRIGLAAGTFLSFDPPWPVQAYGGARLNPLTLLGRNIKGGSAPEAQLRAHRQARTRIDYPIGAAMAFRQDWLQTVGPMDERYFLFYEEADWVEQGRRHYYPSWCEGAIIYHHHGASIGSNQGTRRRSALADYHMIRSRLLFALKWRPWLVPLLCLLGLIQSVRRLCRGQITQAKAVFKAMLPLRPMRPEKVSPAAPRRLKLS